ncbi:MAG: alpha/beta fold hydrolase [Xanthobacteraceae bacterium]
MFEGFARRTLDGDGAAINAVVGGSGPPVLLLHGFPQSLAMWTRIAPRISERYTVVCADLRGYGDSAKPKCLPDRANYSFRAMANDQVAAMRQLGFERFHVIGHDRGGRTAHRTALDHPDCVASLAVLDIVPTYAMFMDTKPPRRRRLLALVFSLPARAFPGAHDRPRSRLFLPDMSARLGRDEA